MRPRHLLLRMFIKIWKNFAQHFNVAIRNMLLPCLLSLHLEKLTVFLMFVAQTEHQLQMTPAGNTWASNAPLQQRQPKCFWAALGKPLATGWMRWLLFSAQHWLGCAWSAVPRAGLPSTRQAQASDQIHWRPIKIIKGLEEPDMRKDRELGSFSQEKAWWGCRGARNLSSVYNLRAEAQEETKEDEPHSGIWWHDKGSAPKLKYSKFPFKCNKPFHYEDYQLMKQAGQKGYGVSVLGHIKNPTRHDPGKLAVVNATLNKGCWKGASLDHLQRFLLTSMIL